jgi:hypothetical protein
MLNPDKPEEIPEHGIFKGKSPAPLLRGDMPKYLKLLISLMLTVVYSNLIHFLQII